MLVPDIERLPAGTRLERRTTPDTGTRPQRQGTAHAHAARSPPLVPPWFPLDEQHDNLIRICVYRSDERVVGARAMFDMSSAMGTRLFRSRSDYATR